LNDSASGRFVGVDLGTTNSALAWMDAQAGGPIRIFSVPQLVGPGEVGQQFTLPSFLYIPTEAERDAGAVRLPWTPAVEDVITGVYAREQGALVPARQISSAKSWLSNALVDRTATLLPWGADTPWKLSPVGASTRILAHLRDAWNHEHARDADALRLERQSIVLTVPASFDEEARELTVRAARDAGFENLTLLEEPLAALYTWIAAHRRATAATFADGALILVCDVGGGTTDFSLIRAAVCDGDLEFERIAIGEHLLLGGDNVDLALAMLVEQKLRAGVKLTLTQRQTLRRKCSAAKERLLMDGSSDGVPITLLGAGRSVVGGGLSTELTRDEVVRTLADGFLPLVAPDDLPARDRRAGLRELGLPYETEPAITKHLAAFLTRAAHGRTPSAERRAPSDVSGMVRPTAVLFNGGFFAPALARERLLDTLGAWFGERPAVLENEQPDTAVAVGAAFYARLRQDPHASRRLIIRAGTARAYYIGVDAGHVSAPAALCVMPRGTQEGTRLDLEREFTVTSNQPAAFTLFSSIDRDDPLNALVSFSDADQVQRHAPLVTSLRYGKRSRRVPLPVRLTTVFTETGTLELWCESRTSDHRWRLAFNLRPIEADPLDQAVAPAASGASEAPGVLVSDEAVERAAELIREVFGAATVSRTPASLVGDLENTLGHGKHAWPLDAIRRLADVFLEVAESRARSAAHEARWLNLAGFCSRPGFGSALDPWRVSEFRKVYAGGLKFPRDVQCQAEWLILWQRVAAGFNGGQQRELAQRIVGQLGIGQRKPPRLNPQIERESWRLLAGLERLDAGQRAKLGGELLDRVMREPQNSAWAWAIGRFGAREPFYGPLSSVIAPATAERWIERLLAVKRLTEEMAGTIAQIGARTGDPARDIPADAAHAAAEHLLAAGIDQSLVEPLRVVGAAERADAGRIFGESLPEGLRLQPQ
jgi:molecular chaperone DnaK (HSP70)